MPFLHRITCTIILQNIATPETPRISTDIFSSLSCINNAPEASSLCLVSVQHRSPLHLTHWRSQVHYHYSSWARPRPLPELSLTDLLWKRVRVRHESFLALEVPFTCPAHHLSLRRSPDAVAVLLIFWRPQAWMFIFMSCVRVVVSLLLPSRSFLCGLVQCVNTRNLRLMHLH